MHPHSGAGPAAVVAPYRYRFIPWIALNLNHNPRTLRYIPEEFKDKVISNEDVLGTLLQDILTVLPEPVQSKHRDLLSVQHPRVNVPEHRRHQQKMFKPEQILYKTLGFSVAQATSSLLSAGKGEFITKGLAPKRADVPMYPGNGTKSFLYTYKHKFKKNNQPCNPYCKNLC